jgi:hypothetical protein
LQIHLLSPRNGGYSLVGLTVRISFPPAESRTNFQYLGCLILAIRPAGSHRAIKEMTIQDV